MKNLTSSVYTFENLRNGGFLYVDKTEYIWKLVRNVGGMFFLSRPRRFGKSLTVSTLKAVFEGKKELFQGLAIYDKPYDWKAYPVIHIDLASCSSHSADELREYLAWELSRLVRHYSLKTKIDKHQLSSSFSDIIEKLNEQVGRVVVLIDEYDKPLLENMTNGRAGEIRDVLSEFYSTLKKEDARERFVFLTGVTKFSQVSLFSKLNNLQDISMNGEFATMLGYTQEEFETNFREWLEVTKTRQELPYDRFLAKIKDWYDGFRFVENAESVYNPVSIASFFFNQGEFRNYWFSTGTPTFLLNLIKATNFDFEKALTEPVEELAFSAYEVDNLDPMALLLQTGYLTIKDSFMEWDERKYRVGFPNREVKGAFETYLLNAYTGVNKSSLGNLLTNMLNSMNRGEAETLMDVMQTFLASIPYDIQLKEEKYYQSIFYTLFLCIGTHVQAEVCTNKGRIDAVVVFDSCVFVIEFKIDGSAQEALAQIRTREYYQKYRHCDRKIHLLGININSQKREIADWLTEEEG